MDYEELEKRVEELEQERASNTTWPEVVIEIIAFLIGLFIIGKILFH
jgi:hypothetical protein